jgi:putative flippase GtrA
MRRHIKTGVVQLLASQKTRYLLGGMFNVAVNYVVGAVIYQALLPRLNFIAVGIIATVVSISISFVTYKLFVFRTKGNWWIEYLRSYVVYGSSAVLNIGVMWLLLNRAHVNIWLAQAIVTVIAVAISYLGHTVFTFRQAKLSSATSAAG